MDPKDAPEDALQLGRPSSEEGQKASEPPKTFTADQVEQAARERHSTLDKQISKLTKSVEIAQKRADDAEAALTQFKADRDTAEMESVREDPDKLSVLQLRQQVRKEEAALKVAQKALEKEKLEHTAEIEAAAETQKEIAVWQMAVKHGVDPVLLKSLDIDSPEKLDIVAKALAANKPKTPSEPGTGEPDSSISAGGLTGIDALAKANDDFSKGLITEKQLREAQTQAEKTK